MTDAAIETSTTGSRTLRIAMSVAVITVAFACTTFAVWFVGLSWLWAVAASLALGALGMVFNTLKFEEHVSWDPPARETPRGVRLAMPMIEQSLAACDRLARPVFARRIRALLIDERDNRSARTRLLRQVRTLLEAELRVRGIAAGLETDEAVIALLGPDALTVLQPNDDTPVTTAAIANCLDALERLHPEPIP